MEEWELAKEAEMRPRVFGMVKGERERRCHLLTVVANRAGGTRRKGNGFDLDGQSALDGGM